MAQEDLIKQFNQLPENIQDLLMSEEIADLIAEEEQLNYLPAQKGQMIASLVADVLLGNLSYKEFTPTLIDKLGVNPIISKNIAQKIESKIFFPVRDDLEKIYRRASLKKKTEELPIKEIPQEVQPEEKPPSEEIKPADANEIIYESAPSIISAETISSVESPKPVVDSMSIEENKTAAKKETPKRSFSSFFHFKKPNHLENKTSSKETSASGPIIIGKEQEFRPVLEEKSPWMISFEEVKPLKEKVVSEIEIHPVDKAPQKIVEESTIKKEKEEEPKEKLEEIALRDKQPESFIPTASFKNKTGASEQIEKAGKDFGEVSPEEKKPITTPDSLTITPPTSFQPDVSVDQSAQQLPTVKIVNYSEKESASLSDVSLQGASTEIKTPESSSPATTISGETNTQEQAIILEKPESPAETLEAQQQDQEKKDTMQAEQPRVPSENVIDLRKLKF
ncbi:MAG: hypothetical protein PHF40_01350 [Candidatus Pacebacteria bacterium]|nr:hypothetical protein [Candidatus Paceibacterota bacterium]